MRWLSSCNRALYRSRYQASIADMMWLPSLVVVVTLQTTSMECRPVIDRTVLPPMAESGTYRNERQSNGTEHYTSYRRLSENEVLHGHRCAQLREDLCRVEFHKFTQPDNSIMNSFFLYRQCMYWQFIKYFTLMIKLISVVSFYVRGRTITAI